MKKAVEKGDFNSVQTAQMMIEIATKKTAEYSDELTELKKEQKIMVENKTHPSLKRLNILVGHAIDLIRQQKSKQTESASKSSDYGKSSHKKSKDTKIEIGQQIKSTCISKNRQVFACFSENVLWYLK